MTTLKYEDLYLYSSEHKVFPDSVVQDLIALFNQVNKDCAAAGEEVYPLTDEYYIDQIHDTVENWIIGGFCILDFSDAAKAGYDQQTTASYKVAEILFKRMQELL